MAADAEMSSAADDKKGDKPAVSAPEKQEVKVNTVQADIQHNLTLLKSAVSILEPRLTAKVLRTLNSIRKRLNGAALKEVIEATYPASESRFAEDASSPIELIKMLYTLFQMTNNKQFF
jgi:26S proteasome regulatory subunit N3